MRRASVALALIVAGCGDAHDAAVNQASAGARLERAALAAGIVRDQRTLDPAGAYGSDSDHVCIVPDGKAYKIGASVDYGEGQRCTVRGTASGAATLKVKIGEDCRFDARFDGERLTFPAEVPAACDMACSGRASLAALAAPQLSAAPAEAQALMAPDGTPLCS